MKYLMNIFVFHRFEFKRILYTVNEVSESRRRKEGVKVQCQY